MQWRSVIPASLLDRWTCDASIARMVLDADGVPLDHGRAVRTATAAQRRALVARDGPCCAVPGCDVPAGWTQAHHVTPWTPHGLTDIDNLHLGCEFHHTRIHAGDLVVRPCVCTAICTPADDLTGLSRNARRPRNEWPYARRVSKFPSLKARRLLVVLQRELGYEVTRQRGSHRVLEAPGRPRLIFAFHDGQTIGPGLVRKILINDVGLSENEALALL